MTVENQNGEKEILTDYQSYAAGYRQAVHDLTGPQRSPSLLPFIGALLVFMLVFRMLSRVTE